MRALCRALFRARPQQDHKETTRSGIGPPSALPVTVAVGPFAHGWGTTGTVTGRTLGPGPHNQPRDLSQPWQPSRCAAALLGTRARGPFSIGYPGCSPTTSSRCSVRTCHSRTVAPTAGHAPWSCSTRPKSSAPDDSESAEAVPDVATQQSRTSARSLRYAPPRALERSDDRRIQDTAESEANAEALGRCR
jgi:hypothetical protein